MFDSAKNADTAIKYDIAVLTFELLKKLNLSAAIFIAQSKIITINKQEIINILNEEFKKDKRKTEVLGMTKLGLVEITRRRERDSIDKYYLEECYTCEGKGSTKSINFILDDIEKEIIRISTHTSYKDVTIELNSRTLKLIKMNFQEE